MLDFNTYVARYGECGVQNLVEIVELREGLAANDAAPLPLEDRWNAVMQAPVSERIAA